MKRKAILLGYSGMEDDNPEYHLTAVENDLKAVRRFLMSPKGGLWDSNEIISLLDDKIIALEKELVLTKNQYDFVLIVYSGHGYYLGCQRLGTSIEGYELNENKFANLAPRQISIFDACAGGNEEIILESVNESIRKYTINPERRKKIRTKYENQIMRCPKQEIRFYAAQPGEQAKANSLESYYISELIDVLNNVEESITIVEAHEIASKKVMKRSFREQHPYYRVFPATVKDYLLGGVDELF